jgi:hypothetical protein
MSIPFTLEHFNWNDDTTAKDWERWLYKFESLLSILKVPFATLGNRTALDYLIPYGGDKMIDLMTSLANATTITYAEFKTLVGTNFTNTNLRFNTWVFRSAKQAITESLPDFVTRLRILAAQALIEPGDIDKEIMYQVTCNTHSKETRTKALDQTVTLAALLVWHKSQSLNKKLEQQIEEAQASQYPGEVSRIQQQFRSNTNKAKQSCRNCGGQYPHVAPDICAAKGVQCTSCKRYNHFRRFCRSSNNNNAKPSKRAQNNRPANKNKTNVRFSKSDESSSDEAQRKVRKRNNDHINQLKQPDSDTSEDDVVYKVHALQSETQIRDQTKLNIYKQITPHATITIHGTPMRHTIDTGANVNVMSETSYRNLAQYTQLNSSKAKILAFSSKIPLEVIGEFHVALSYNKHTANARYIVLNDKHIALDTLLSYNTASELNIIKLNLEQHDMASNEYNK